MSAIWRLIRHFLGMHDSPTPSDFEMESNLDSNECELDSTWDDEHGNKTFSKKVYRKSRRNMHAAKDTQDFRHSCRNMDDGDDESGRGRFYNLEFYRGQIKSSPNDIHIDDFHNHWRGQYYKLENVHTYIQWLFPLQVPGMNSRAHVLTKKEIKYFRRDKKALINLVKSYEIMLDFYGIHLVNKDTGEVERADNWKQRFRHMNIHTLNNLRITRILKCLGTLGLEHYQAPLVKFFLHETLVMGELQSLKQSVLDYFMFAVLDKSKRRELVRYAYEHFRPRENFVWGPKMILLKEKAKKGEQQRVKTTDSTNENNKADASPPEEMRSEKPSKNMRQDNMPDGNGDSKKTTENDMPVGIDVDMKQDNLPDGYDKKTTENDMPGSPNMLAELNITCDQGSNDENSQRILKKESMKKQNQEMSIGDDQDDDDGNEMSLGDDNYKCSP